MQRRARRYDTGEPILLSVEGRLVTASEPLGDDATGAGASLSSHDADLPWIAPGLIDIQVNGHGGREFASAQLTVDEVARIAAQMQSQGVTRFCPTLTTESTDVLTSALATISRACEMIQGLDQTIAGVHLEGPFITREEGPRGAHPAAHCRRPDWPLFQRLQEAAGGRIRVVTLSPEYDGAPVFIERAVAAGLVVAIGHTSAAPARIHDAVSAGARLATHLGNGCHPRLHRHRNCLWPQLADDRLTISMIVDGHHLPADVVRVFTKSKSPARCLLISDMSGLAGLPPGRYPSSLCEVEILDDGRLVVAGQEELLAAAASPLLENVAHAMQMAELSLGAAIDMASLQPARMLGLSAGRFERGAPADFILFDFDEPHAGGPGAIRLREVLAAGRSIRPQRQSAS